MQKDGPHVVFQSVDLGVNSDTSVDEDGLQLGECVFGQMCFFLYFCGISGVWSYCEAKVFKGANFYSFPFAKSLKYRNV